MDLTQIRTLKTHEETLSELYINSKFRCYILEDEEREKKVAGETRIPSGVYHLKMRYDSPKYQKYDNQFKKHKGMIWLQNVPGFSWIYMHIGNTEADTRGCLLVGHGYQVKDGRITVLSSKNAYLDIYYEIQQAIEREEVARISIINADRDLIVPANISR